MKKIKFLNGISAVFALAVVALATTLTSCEKEEFNVNVTPTNAQAVISPIVLAIEDGVTTDVTGQATIAPAELTFTGNPTLAAKSVDVTASYNGLSATVTVKVPALQAGHGAFLHRGHAGHPGAFAGHEAGPCQHRGHVRPVLHGRSAGTGAGCAQGAVRLSGFRLYGGLPLAVRRAFVPCGDVGAVLSFAGAAYMVHPVGLRRSGA